MPCVRLLCLVAVGLSVGVLNGCADAPGEGEDRVGSDSDLTRPERRRPASDGTAGGKIGSKGSGDAETDPVIPSDEGPEPEAPIPDEAADPPAGGTPAPAPVTIPPPPANALPVLVTWNGVANTEGSFDLVLNSGEIVGPCAGVDVLRDEFRRGVSDGLRYRFTGHCPSPNRSYAAGDIRAFRICSATNNDWANARCTESAPWNRTNATVKIDN